MACSMFSQAAAEKRSVVAQVQAWKKSAPVDEVAKKAAVQVLARLP